MILRDMEEDEMEGEMENLELEVMDVFACGDLAVEVGRWTETEDDEIETGTYMSIFKKVNETYVCIRDIWNTTSEVEMEVEEDTQEASIE